MKHALLLLTLSLSLHLVQAQKPTNSKNKTVDLAVISTPKGDITVYLYEGTPKHRENFLKLAAQGYFNGTTFHRVIPKFVAQGGDPNSKDTIPANDGNGGPGYDIDAEINPLYYHKRGAIGAARDGDDVNPLRKSSGSQFYIVLGQKWSEGGLDSQQTRVRQRELQAYARTWLARPDNQWINRIDLAALQQSDPDSLLRLQARIDGQIRSLYAVEHKEYTITPEQRKLYTTLGGTPHLDGGYTVFGEVLSGMDVADALAAVPRDSNDRPLTNLPMQVKVITLKEKDFVAKYKVAVR